MQVYQTVELADGTWDIFSLVTGERVTIAATKTEAVALVAAMNQHSNRVMEVFADIMFTPRVLA